MFLIVEGAEAEYVAACQRDRSNTGDRSVAEHEPFPFPGGWVEAEKKTQGNRIGPSMGNDRDALRVIFHTPEVRVSRKIRSNRSPAEQVGHRSGDPIVEVAKGLPISKTLPPLFGRPGAALLEDALYLLFRGSRPVRHLDLGNRFDRERRQSGQLNQGLRGLLGSQSRRDDDLRELVLIGCQSRGNTLRLQAAEWSESRIDLPEPIDAPGRLSVSNEDEFHGRRG